jgi:hypothetical protein
VLPAVICDMEKAHPHTGTTEFPPRDGAAIPNGAQAERRHPMLWTSSGPRPPPDQSDACSRPAIDTHRLQKQKPDQASISKFQMHIKIN